MKMVGNIPKAFNTFQKLNKQLRKIISMELIFFEQFESVIHINHIQSMVMKFGLFKLNSKYLQQLSSNYRQTMLKRCHSLKRSQIKLPKDYRQKSISKYRLEQQQDKQNISTNFKYSNVLLIKSIQLSKQHTITSLCSSNNKILSQACSKLGEANALQKIKQMCRQIDTVNKKIEMYKQILRNKEARHDRIRNQRMEKNQSTLAELIESFQYQKEQNERLNKQLTLLGFEQASEEKDGEDPRRTTATFNFMFSK